jgi:hypothetical protein
MYRQWEGKTTELGSTNKIANIYLDKWSDKAVSWKAPDSLNPALYKVFERYNLGEKAMLCLWRNGQLNTPIH